MKPERPERPERLRPPDGAPGRLSTEPFPAYAYVPRREPHPVTDPRGHSFGLREEALELGRRELPGDWRAVEEYLYGVDLFNAAFFWEAHESWEAVWHAVERDSTVGRFLQGMIQAAAAMLQRHCGHAEGSINLLERSRGNLAPALAELGTGPDPRSGGPRYMGVPLAAWQRRLEAWVEGRSRSFPFLRLDP